MSAPAASCPTPIPVPRAPIAPLPPAMWTRTRGALDSPIFRRWVVLSILLHVLVILLFGAPSGGHREGRAMFGRLSVVIQEGWRDTGPDLKIERALAPKPAPVAPSEAVPNAPIPPMLERLPTPEALPELAPAPRVPAPVEAAPVPVPAPVLLEAVPAPKVENTLVDTPPEPQPLPAPVPPVLLEPMPAPRIERQMIEAPPVAPAPLETVAPAPLEPLAAPRIERLVEPPPMPAIPEPAPAPPAIPAPAPTTPTPARESITPPRVTAPADIPRGREPPRDPTSRELPSRDLPSPERAPGESLFRRTQPAPPSPSPAYDPTAAPPALDLDAMRKRAGELGRLGTGNRAALPFPMPPVPAKKSTLESAIEKARKPDCRDAYKHLGLAAVVPLIANEFGEGKCRW